MKRFASIFKKTRQSQPASSTKGDDTTRAPEPSPAAGSSRPGVSPVPDLAGGSSASSSTISADLRTPDDDGASNRFPSPGPGPTPRQKKAWTLSWAGPSRRSSSTRSLASNLQEEQQRPVPSPAPPIPALPRTSSMPVRSTASTQIGLAALANDDSDESDSDEETYGTSVTTLQAVRRTTPGPLLPMSPQTLAQALANFRQLTLQSLVPPFSPPPLLHLPGKSLFPRSANAPAVLVRQESLRSRALRSHLLRRLEHKPLPAEDVRALAPFATRTPSEKHRRSSFVLDENAVGGHGKRIGADSTGLRRWVKRAPFEERFSVWTPDGPRFTEATVVTARPGFAVASLEVSEELERLAGLIGEHFDLLDQSPPSPASALHPRPHRPSPMPSPLRTEHVGLRSASSPALVTAMPTTPSPLSAAPSTPAAKAGVRFSVAAAADEDPSDLVPLGYVQRVQQNKAEKTKFLQEEQVRRKHAEEARKMAAERAQWEQERAQWAQEREARKQRELAEQYAAARDRQARSREGSTPVSIRRSSMDAKPSAQRQWSDPAVVPRKDPSPGSTRPPSVASGRSGRAYPTPMSSVEDVRMRNRSSVSVTDASERGRRSRRTSTHGSIRPVSHALPPPLPLDAPLLPPTAPFMHEFGGRPRSGSGGSHSPARSSSGTSSAGGSQRGPLPSSRSSDSVPRSMHTRQASAAGSRMSVAMPVMYPGMVPGPQTPPAGYWMVPVPVAVTYAATGVPLPGIAMPVMAPASASKRKSIVY